MATTERQETPYTPAKNIEYPKPNTPYCWTPEPVINVPDEPVGPGQA